MEISRNGIERDVGSYLDLGFRVDGLRWMREHLSHAETVASAISWSSYRSYVGLAPPEEILDYRWLELMGRATTGGNQRAYRRYVSGFVVDEDDVLAETMKASRYAIGDERFRERTEEGVLGVRLHKADDGDIVWPAANGVAAEYVLAVVAAHFKVSEADLRFHGRRLGMIKAVAIELCCRFSGQTQRDIARLFGYRDSSSVGKRRQALAAYLVDAPALRRHIAKLEKKITALKS